MNHKKKETLGNVYIFYSCVWQKLRVRRVTGFVQPENLLQQTHPAWLTLTLTWHLTSHVKNFHTGILRLMWSLYFSDSALRTSSWHSVNVTCVPVFTDTCGSALSVCVCACLWRRPLLFSPSTVLIKASGGRQKGWAEREGGGRGRDVPVWVPDLCDVEVDRREWRRSPLSTKQHFVISSLVPVPTHRRMNFDCTENLSSKHQNYTPFLKRNSEIYKPSNLSVLKS